MFFSKPLSKAELQQVELLIKQVKASAELVNTTVKPDVFFGRLGFLLDGLKQLGTYEKYHLFHGSTPTKDLDRILANLNNTVNDFIIRAAGDADQKISQLKTIKGKRNRVSAFYTKMIYAFDNARTYWQGNQRYPHYTGPLYYRENIDLLKKEYNNLIKKYDISLG